jgi:hypothetical protein
MIRFLSALVFLTSIAFGAQSSQSNVCNNLLNAPLGAARFAKQLDGLQKFVPADNSSQTIDRTIDLMMKEDARNYLFKLEGLARLYKKKYEPFKEQRYALKEIEDFLGHATDKVDFYNYAKDLGGVPTKVLGAMKEVRAIHYGELKAYMPKFGDTLADLKADVDETNWKKENGDTKVVLKRIIKEIKEIEDLPFDLNLLEEGVHKMRRSLRWILIYIQAVDGMILTEAGAGKLNEYSYLESHDIAKSKFSSLPANKRIRHEVLIPLTYFLALSKVVQELGVIKSTGEHVHAIADGYSRSGLAKTPEEAERKATELVRRGDPKFVPDVTAAATQVRNELLRTNLLKKLRKVLQKSLP